MSPNMKVLILAEDAVYSMEYGRALVGDFISRYSTVETYSDIISMDELSIYLNTLLPTIKSIETILSEITLMDQIDNGYDLPIFIDMKFLDFLEASDPLTTYILELIQISNKNEVLVELYNLLKDIINQFIRDIEPIFIDALDLLENTYNIMIQIPKFIDFNYFERLSDLFHDVYVEHLDDFIRIQILRGEGADVTIESIYYYPKYGYITT